MSTPGARPPSGSPAPTRPPPQPTVRALFVVQRSGREVAGGAETCCREFATRLGARGHEVEVLTSTALSYLDWANHYPAGTAELHGVVLHRLPVDGQRDDRFFTP